MCFFLSLLQFPFFLLEDSVVLEADAVSETYHQYYVLREIFKLHFGAIQRHVVIALEYQKTKRSVLISGILVCFIIWYTLK